MSFASSLGPWLAVATVVIMGATLALARWSERRTLTRLGPSPQLSRMIGSYSPRRRRLQNLVFAVAMTLIAVALARPQIRGRVERARRGIDVVVAMDFSKSMLAEDVRPNRLERMKEGVERLLDKLHSARVGVVVFAGGAGHFPLTHDSEAARDMFRELSVVDLPSGSDLGQAILVARCIVRPGEVDDPGCRRLGGRGGNRRQAGRPAAGMGKRGRAIVVITDGEDTAGGAREQVEIASALGIEVFLVGVGTTAGHPVPEVDVDGNVAGWKKAADGESHITTRLDLDGLSALAEAAGGRDQLLLQGRGQRFPVAGLVASLERIERDLMPERAENQPRDIYAWFLFPGFLLLVISACMSTRRRTVLYDRGPL